VEKISDKISRQYVIGSQAMLVKWMYKKGGTYPSKIFRRVFGLFWPIFDFKLGGLYTSVDIAPRDLNRKAAQKNRKID
jgi:hypothetical protein